MEQRKTILFVHYGENWIRGSEQALLNIIIHIDKEKFRPIVWTNCTALHNKLNSLSIPTQLDKFSLLFGWAKPKYSVSNWFRLIFKGCDLIRKNSVDIVHVNSGGPVQWMAAACKISNVPMLTLLHCDYTLRDRVSLGLYLSQKTVLVSEAISQNLRNDGYPSNRIKVIHNGIDLSLLTNTPIIKVKQRLNLSENSFLFVTIGSLIFRKGIDKIIKAMQDINCQSRDIHLLIVGEGEEKQTLSDQAQGLGLEKHIHFVSEQNRPIAWLRGGCDAFISAARSEAFGLVIAEAGLSALPIIAPNIDGIPEVVHHNQSAILYDPNNKYALPSAMLRLHQSKPLQNWLATNAHKRIVKNFSITQKVNDIELEYFTLINRSQNEIQFR
ncbi:glycosyltransferase family 4 protein [Vibrio algarum]|uniref:Glycosyltransferase family 4 protein n=1 Tax=Vibrio algarum TaxID=3020714 RepID=A0ABT4YWF0_9VIBR|nr:glycosyltransferase family 4 protein [Vibrio sp. KJ40-1]MDB1125717.1 glycosyltransferase family 4 protein [Vibrio sp. KJ40-1]